MFCLYSSSAQNKITFYFLFWWEIKKPSFLATMTYITPCIAQARGEDIMRGVNYASAAAGVREETGRQLVSHSLNRMICIIKA